MDTTIIVVDNFLENPDIVRESAITLDYPKTGSFPGFRSLKVGYEYAIMIKQKFEQIIGKEIFFPYNQDSFCFQVCMENTDSWVHTDATEWSAVLYLTPNPEVITGTAFYTDNRENKNSSDFTDDDFSLNTLIGNFYNRLVLFKGNKNFHRSFMSGFGDSIETARLTQVFFFNTYDDGQKQISI